MIGIEDLALNRGDDWRYRDLTFRCAFQQNGVAELPALMTPSGGGTSELPVFRFVGGMADATDWTTWDYPATPVACARQAVATPPTYNDGSPYFGSDDDSVLFNASDYYAAPNNTFADITTDDLVFEVIFRINAAVNFARVVSKMDGNNAGWACLLGAAGNTVRFRIEDATTTGVNISTAAVTIGAWQHGLCFCDRSGSGQWYLQGAATGAPVGLGAVGNITVAKPLTIGASDTGASNFSGQVAYAALWKKSAWLTSHLNDDTAKERFGVLAGYLPQVYKGTRYPTVRTRAAAKYIVKTESGVSRLYLVGADWLGLSEIGGRQGIDIGPQRENDIAESNDFTAWTKEDAGDVVTDDAALGPENATSMATLVCDNTNGNHGLTYQTPGNLSADPHSFSIGIGSGVADWWKLEDVTVANAHCWFNVTTGAIGATPGAALIDKGFVLGEYLGTGTAVRRPYIKLTGTVAQHTFRVRPVDADNSDTFSGGDGVAVTGYLRGAQCEQGDYPSSLIDTDGASVTRAADSLRFKADDGNIGGVGSNKRGSVQFYVRLPEQTLSAVRALVVLSDGGSTDDRVRIGLAATGYARLLIVAATATTVDITGTNVKLADGNWHRVFARWEENDARLEIDGVLEGRDTTCAMPDDLDRLEIGQNVSGTGQPCAMFSDVRINGVPARRAS